MSESAKWSTGAALIPVALLCPFLGKAYHVDDTLFLYTAQQILKAPLDFYGFSINWYATPQPMSEVMQNPPLQSYLLALAGGLFGWSEYALHAVMLLPAFAACWFTAKLAGRLEVSPVWAALGLGLSPGFFVSATQVMCDVTFLAFYLAAIYLWIRGLDRQCQRYLALAAIAASAALLTKYFGLTLVPLLGAYTICRGTDTPSNPAKPRAASVQNSNTSPTADCGERRGCPAPTGPLRHARGCLWLSLPVLVLAAYEYYTAQCYGRGLFTDAILYARHARAQLGDDMFHAWGGGMVYFAAGLTIPSVWALIALYRISALRYAVPVAASVGLVMLILIPKTRILPRDDILGCSVAVQWTGWFVLGILCLSLLIVEWRRHGNGESLLLSLWILGTLVFATGFNHYINARVLLPTAPAVVILALRNQQFKNATMARTVLGTAAVALGACTLYIAAADQRLANDARRAAKDALATKDAQNLWFTGHWGFQYYMEQGGARAVDMASWAWEGGDLLVLPKNNGIALSLPESAMQRYEVRAYPVLQGVSTLNSEVGAGFYADSIGPLPYVLGPASAEQYGLVWLRPMQPAGIHTN